MEKLVVSIMAISAVVILGLFLAWPMSMLWNGCLVPAATGLHEVGIIQMWGISILMGFLFSGVSSK